MFLSQLAFDPLGRKAMKTLSDIYDLHQVVMQAFKGYDIRPRILYRLEPEMHQEKIVVLVQSPVEPFWSDEICSKADIISTKTKKFAPVIRNGATLRFRLRANPTVKREGKRYGLIRQEALEEWLTRWEDRVGAKFASFDVVDEGYIKGTKGTQRLRIKTVRFEGHLIVNNLDDFYKCLNKGIGPAKGFGCGMLSIAPA